MLGAQVPASQKFKVDRSTNGDVTALSFHGVIDEGFEGKKLGDSVRTNKVVLNLRDVRRFASWGMAEWAEFLRLNAARETYVVECSTQALGQFNLVTGLLASARLVSFFIPYRCSKCSEELDKLFVLPTDTGKLALLEDSSEACNTCGGLARVDKYVIAMVNTILERSAFDISDEVLAYLRSTYKYDITPDVNRFRAHRRAGKDYNYLRVSGNLAGMPTDVIAAASEATTVVDLARILPLDSQGAKTWRAYLAAALPNVKALQLLDCPPGFIEQALVADDFTKVMVRTFALTYSCASCDATTTIMVDVAAQLEYLVTGILPAARCSSCQLQLEPVVSPALDAIVRRLPARPHDVALDKFLEKTRAEPADKLEDATVRRVSKPAAPVAGAPMRAMYVAIGIMVVVAAGLGVLGWRLWKDRNETSKRTAAVDTVVPPRPSPTFQRPDWVLSDLPSSAYCHDLTNRIMCVGISSFRGTRNEGVDDANDAALDELVATIGLKMTHPFFRDRVLPAYAEPRAKALAALQAADVDRTSDAYKAANDVVRAARKRVAEAFKASGGPTVPAQRSDWYWEEYALEKGSGTEVLVFVRYDVSNDVLKSLVERYTTEVALLDGKVVTTFPALGWRDSGAASGAIVVDAGRRLAGMSVAAGDTVTALNGEKISDAWGLEKRTADSTSDPWTLSVMSLDGTARAVEIKR